MNSVTFSVVQCEFFESLRYLEFTFRVFRVVLEDPGLTMDVSLLSLTIF